MSLPNADFSYHLPDFSRHGDSSGPAVDSRLLGVQSCIPLRITTSDIVSAGSGIIAEKGI
jgi:hypothetical protein